MSRRLSYEEQPPVERKVAGAMPAQAAISERHDRDAREEDSNPPRLGRGTPCAEAQRLQTRSAICVAAGAANTRGSTEARDHFSAPVAEQTTGIRLLNGTTQVRLLPGAPHSSQRTECAARLLSGVSLVRCQGEEPFHNGARPAGRGRCLENSRTSNGVQGSSPWRSAFSRPCSSTDLERSSPKGSDASATLARDNARMVQ